MTDNDQSTNFTHESSQYLRIPLNRIGPVIGVKGVNREKIEKDTLTKIIIDSDTGEVEIRPNKDLKDPIMLIKASNIVKAIGRGFSHQLALKLISDDYFLEVIRLKSYIKGNSRSQYQRIKGRIIGKKGVTKKAIEELTSINLVVSGNTISLIGTYEELQVGRDAVTKIITGSPIESVLGILEQQKKDEKDDKDKLWKSTEDDEPLEEMIEKFEKETDKEEEDIFKDFEEEKDAEKEEETESVENKE